MTYTSTINPNVPALGATLSSAVVQQNFLAAYTDVNALALLIGGSTTAPSAGLVSSNGTIFETTTISGGSWSAGTLTLNYQAPALTTIGDGLALNSGTLSASLTQGANIAVTNGSTVAATGLLIASNNLSDVSSANTSRVNVNQGTASLSAASATISTNAANGNVFTATLVSGTGPYTLANPTNLKAGATYLWVITQPASGSTQTMTFGGNWKFGQPYSSSTPPTLTATLGAVDIISAYSDGTYVYATLAPNFS